MTKFISVRGREATTSSRSPSKCKVFVSLSRTALAHQPLSQLPLGCYLGGQFKLLSLVQLSLCPLSSILLPSSPRVTFYPSPLLPSAFLLVAGPHLQPQLPSCFSPCWQPSSPNCPQVLGETSLAILGSASFPTSWLDVHSRF